MDHECSCKTRRIIIVLACCSTRMSGKMGFEVHDVVVTQTTKSRWQRSRNLACDRCLHWTSQATTSNRSKIKAIRMNEILHDEMSNIPNIRTPHHPSNISKSRSHPIHSITPCHHIGQSCRADAPSQRLTKHDLEPFYSPPPAPGAKPQQQEYSQELSKR